MANLGIIGGMGPRIKPTFTGRGDGPKKDTISSGRTVGNGALVYLGRWGQTHKIFQKQEQGEMPKVKHLVYEIPTMPEVKVILIPVEVALQLHPKHQQDK